MKNKYQIKLKPVRMMYPKGSNFDSSNEYFIFSCESDSSEIEKHPTFNNFSISGNMQRLDLGMEYTATLTKKEDREYSYEVESIFQELPTSGYKQRDFFRAILTEHQFKALYDVYGYQDDLIEKFKNDEIDISKVRGLGEESYKKVKDKIMKTLDYQVLLSELSKYGVTFNTVVKLVEMYGSSELAVQKVKNNPYSLAKLKGFGFIKADVIAKNMSMEDIKIRLEQGEITKEQANLLYVEQVFKSPFRIQTGILHLLNQNQNEGHTFIFNEDLIKQGYELLQVANELIIKEIINLHNDNLIFYDENRVALIDTYETEEYIAEWITEKNKNSEELNFDVEDFISRMEAKHNIQLTDQQKGFFYNVKEHSVHLLVGNAGCGKSFLQKLLKELLQELGKVVKWLAPTGNASKVLSSYVGDNAETIHRAIGYGQRNDSSTSSKDIEADYIIVDETSMLDVTITKMLLSRITNPKARLLFLGDTFQIPSVSHGNVLHDMVECDILPCTKLDAVFRQKEGGALDVATNIRLGNKFIDNNATGEYKYGKDFKVVCIEKDQMIDGYLYYYKKYLEKYKPEEIMVLSVKKNGDLGTIAINRTIQNLVNPQSPMKVEIPFGEENVLREQDYIINIKNTYDIKNNEGYEVDIVNGDKGIVYEIIKDWKPDKHGQMSNLIMDFDDEEVEDKNGIYTRFDTDDVKLNLKDTSQLLHAWCLTAHKSQGSSSKAVIIIADGSHSYNLNANILYVAVTRLTVEGVLICQPEVINRSMKKVINLSRNTFLQELIKREYKKINSLEFLDMD